jgi:predicted nucleotidyltransferase
VTPTHGLRSAAYHRELVRRLRSILADQLVGVYAGGSFALGDFRPGRSDLDVIAIVRSPLSLDIKEALVEALRWEKLAGPARGLEFVIYTDAVARTPSDEAAFDLNLNTGPAMGLRVDLEPGAVERHWFSIDRDVAAHSGVALDGPPAGSLFAPIPRPLLLPVVRESLEWHLRGSGSQDDAVLNACRALHYVREDAWISKAAAGEWALGKVADDPLVSAALAARDQGAELERERVERFIRGVISEATDSP